jgi:hypothetical protein
MKQHQNEILDTEESSRCFCVVFLSSARDMMMKKLKPNSSSLTSKIHAAEGQFRDVIGLISVSIRFGSRLEFQILKLFNKCEKFLSRRIAVLLYFLFDDKRQTKANC